jgi:hypothetical protein
MNPPSSESAAIRPGTTAGPSPPLRASSFRFPSTSSASARPPRDEAHRADGQTSGAHRDARRPRARASGRPRAPPPERTGSSDTSSATRRCTATREGVGSSGRQGSDPAPCGAPRDLDDEFASIDAGDGRGRSRSGVRQGRYRPGSRGRRKRVPELTYRGREGRARQAPRETRVFIMGETSPRWAGRWR